MPILVRKIVNHNTSNCKSIITVNITRNCKYSHVLLMMGEDVARNM